MTSTRCKNLRFGSDVSVQRREWVTGTEHSSRKRGARSRNEFGGDGSEK